MEAGKDDVGGEGAIDADLYPQVVLGFGFLGEADVLVDGAEPAFYVFVLSFVKGFEGFGFGGGFVGGNGAEAVSFAGGTGADEVELAGGFEFGGEGVGVCVKGMLEGTF